MVVKQEEGFFPHFLLKWVCGVYFLCFLLLERENNATQHPKNMRSLLSYGYISSINISHTHYFSFFFFFYLHHKEEEPLGKVGGEVEGPVHWKRLQSLEK